MQSLLPHFIIGNDEKIVPSLKYHGKKIAFPLFPSFWEELNASFTNSRFSCLDQFHVQNLLKSLYECNILTEKISCLVGNQMKKYGIHDNMEAYYCRTHRQALIMQLNLKE